MFKSFIFLPASTVKIDATQTASAATPLVSQSESVEVSNEGPNTVFVEFGGSTMSAAAVNTGYPVLAGQSKIIRRPTSGSVQTHVSVVCASGQTAKVFFSLGTGV